MQAALCELRAIVARNRQVLATVACNLQTVTSQHNNATKLQALGSSCFALAGQRHTKLGGGCGSLVPRILRGGGTEFCRGPCTALTVFPLYSVGKVTGFCSVTGVCA